MIVEMKRIPVCASEEVEMIKITEDVKKCVAETGVQNGVVFVITAHTTTGITVNENLSCVEEDIKENLERLIPTVQSYNHAHFLLSYGATGGNSPGHLKSLLTGNHCVYPIIDGKVIMGSAADIYFVEYDGIKKREYFVHVMGE